MSRYFVDYSQINEDTGKIKIQGEDYQHLKKVLRVVNGDNITVCCDGIDYTTQVDSIESNFIDTHIIDKSTNTTEPRLKVTLYQGLPKSDKMELVIQKCVELGVTEIVPVITERCVVKINSHKDAENKVIRWQRIALEAAKQCNRGIIPKVAAPIKFEEALKLSSSIDLSVIPYEKETAVGLKTILSTCKDVSTASIFIGPEGGFTEKEISLAEFNDIKKLTLGPRILRTETAGVVALSIMMYELGDVSR